ncbi:MAG: polysaccharide biosynthesis C-terminal domain-containing protein [Kiritimatiellae bacterium]|nr:polysaccharide biosynthesis C-terminal domain-containing protein [Kiritimatiellia bacterium]
MSAGGAIARLRARFGDLWWWSAIIFLACRSGDAIQAFAGLWLVPKMVGEAELGAALPLLQFSSVFALPLSIVTIPFSRWLSIYSVRGEYGKIKRMLSIVFWGAGAVFVLSILLARFVLPAYFERLRVAEGSLGILLIAAGIAGPLSSVFTSSLQGLRRFGAVAVSNVVGAPLRLVVLLVAMPFRALSGYLLGQIAAPAATTAIALASLRHDLGAKVRSVALGRRDLGEMLRYTWPVAISSVVVCLASAWQALLIRQRLPEVESAAFYVISRLAETAAYAGTTITLVMFPLAAEAKERGDVRGELALLKRVILGSFAPGAAIALVFAFASRQIFSLVSVWEPYAQYAPLTALHTLRTALGSSLVVAGLFEMAAGRFKYLVVYLPIVLFETGALVVLTGWGAVEPYAPQWMTDAVAALAPARLSFFVKWLFASAVLQAAALAAFFAVRAIRSRQRRQAVYPSPTTTSTSTSTPSRKARQP